MTPGTKESILESVQIEQVGSQQGTGGRKSTEVGGARMGKCRAAQEKSSRAWCDLLVYNQYLSEGRMNHEHLLWKTLHLEGAFDLTSVWQTFFKDPENFVQVR